MLNFLIATVRLFKQISNNAPLTIEGFTMPSGNQSGRVHTLIWIHEHSFSVFPQLPPDKTNLKTPALELQPNLQEILDKVLHLDGCLVRLLRVAPQHLPEPHRLLCARKELKPNCLKTFRRLSSPAHPTLDLQLHQVGERMSNSLPGREVN